MHGDDDAAFLFEPLPDTGQALAIGNCSSNLGPKSANLTSLRGWLSPAPLREAVSGFGYPLLLGFCVFFTLSHVFDSLRRISAYFNRYSTDRRHFDSFRRASTSNSWDRSPCDRLPDRKHR
ncbi:MAG: hypothetical protein ACLQKA_08690 [Bryobacteraceae bacterium]